MAFNTAVDILTGLDVTDTRPSKIVLIANPGSRTQEVMPAFLNPAGLKETISVEWALLPVIGLDHEIPHYSRTKSLEYPLSFYFSAYEAARRVTGLAQDVLSQVDGTKQTNSVTAPLMRQATNSSMEFANFFRSLGFPTRSGLRPPTVKVIWPNVFDLLGVMKGISFEYMSFDRQLAPIIYRADVVFLETRVTRRYSEQVRISGLTADTDIGGTKNRSSY